MISRKLHLLAATALLVVTLTGCDSPEEKQAQYMKRGNELFQKGAYEKARIEYKNAARLKPSDAEVRYRMGLIDEAQNDLPAAFKAFIAAEQQDARHHATLLKLAQYFLAGDQNEEAQKRINILLQDSPDDPDAHALSASLHLRRKAYDLAEKEVGLSLSKDPDNVVAYSVLTGLSIAQGNMEKAGASVEEGIKRNPENVGLLLLKAMIYEKTSNLEKIAEAYAVIFKIRPTEIRFRQDLATVYTQAQKLDEAEQTLREGVATMPDKWEMKKKLVGFLNEKRGLDSAETTIKDYMARYPDQKDLLFWLADLYIANKATDRAIALLQDVAAKPEEDIKEQHSLTARTSLARIYFTKGDKELAEKLTQGVLDLDPNNAEALLVRARMLVDQGEYQSAVVALRTIVRDHPTAAEPLQLLGESLLAQGYIDLAIDTLGQLVDAAPTSSPAKVRLAQLLAAQGEHQRALALLALVTQFDPTYAVGWESTARIAIMIKNWELAESAIQSLAVLDGRANVAQFLRGQVALGKDLPQEALPYLTSVAQADPSSPLAGHALLALYDAYKKENKLQEALAYFESFQGNEAIVGALLGRAYTELNKKEEAALAYDKAIAARSLDVDAYLARARLYAEQKKYDEAMAVLLKADGLSAADPRPMMMRAEMLTTKGHYQEALALYEKILARNPKVDIAANNAAQLIADFLPTDQAALEKARILSERFIRSANPYFLDTLAWVYFRQGKVDQAQTIFERILAGEQTLPASIYYHYGLLLVKTGRLAEAKQAMEKAVKSDVPYQGLDDARKVLSSL